MVPLSWIYLGRVAYPIGLRLQQAHARRVASGGPPRLLMMEHPPTVTLGRSADPANLRLSAAEYARRGIAVERVLRGGDVTYHGPGQLVGYPVAHLDSAGCSVPEWVEGICQALIATLARFGLRAHWSDLHPGVWIGQEKIAAVGFQIRRRVSTHGFALNVDPDLQHFETIIPCGLRGLGVTSLQRLGVGGHGLQEVAALVAEEVASRFGWDLGPRLLPAEVLQEEMDGSVEPVVG